MVIGIDAHDLEGNRTGVGRYLMNILRAWEHDNATANDRVILFFKTSIPNDLPHAFEKQLLSPPFGRPSNALFMHVLLPRAAKRAAVDVLWCPGYVAPLIWRGPLVLTLHDIIYEARPDLFNWKSPADRFLLKFISKRSARRAQKVLVPSQFTREEVERRYRIPSCRIVVTPEAADSIFHTLHDATQIQETVKRYGVTGPYFFFVGSIFTRRHIPECIKAFSKISQEFPKHAFLITGANHTKPRINLTPLIADANVKCRRRAVVWVPYASSEDLPLLYQGADATIWLSDYEGFGLPPLESLASGTPVITTKATALPETVGACARFVENPRDAEEIASAMRDVLSNNVLLHQLISCGKERVAQFSWDRCAEQTLHAIHEAIGT